MEKMVIPGIATDQATVIAAQKSELGRSLSIPETGPSRGSQPALEWRWGSSCHLGANPACLWQGEHFTRSCYCLSESSRAAMVPQGGAPSPPMPASLARTAPGPPPLVAARPRQEILGLEHFLVR
jgi:hypothetical protein